MKAGDLRIDNWVIMNNSPHQLDAGDLKNIYMVMENYGKDDARYLSPLPLTPEILEKNGWIKTSGYWVLKGYSTRLGWRNGEMVVGYSALPEKILYVHELQNLMKAVKISCNFEI